MAEPKEEKRALRYVVIRCVMPAVTTQKALEVEAALQAKVEGVEGATVDLSMSEQRQPRGPRV